MGHQGSPAAKANSLLGCVRKSTGGRWREVTLPLCSALLRPHLECCVQCWAAQYSQLVDLLKQVQQRAPKLVEGTGASFLRGKAERWGTVQCGEEKAWRGLSHVYKIPSEPKKTLFDCEGCQSLEQVAQRGFGVALHGDSRNPARQGAEQAALADPASAEGFD